MDGSASREKGINRQEEKCMDIYNVDGRRTPPPPSLFGDTFSLPLLLQTLALALVFTVVGIGGVWLWQKRKAGKTEEQTSASGDGS